MSCCFVGVPRIKDFLPDQYTPNDLQYRSDFQSSPLIGKLRGRHGRAVTRSQTSVRAIGPELGLGQGGWDKVSKSRDQRAHFTPSLVKECDFSDQQRSDLAQ